MGIGMIIGSTIAFIIIGTVFLVFYNAKDRKETLTVYRDGNTMRLLLSQDDYWKFDISDIKDDQKRVDEELVKVIKARAKELVKFVDRVSFFEDGDEKFEQELFSIIQQAKV